VKEMSFKSGVKGRSSDRWWERRWWLWWGDMSRIMQTRRVVNRIKLTEWRRELIPQVRWYAVGCQRCAVDRQFTTLICATLQPWIYC